MNRTTRFFGFTTLAVLCLAMTSHVIAQEDTGTDEADTLSVTMAQGVTAALLAQDVRSAKDLWVASFNTGLASEDGHYLAQNAAELETYNDLKLGYQYIEEDYLRKQLGLEAEQGIIIAQVDATGEGARNGFLAGDIVLKIDQEAVDTQYDFVIELTKDRGQQRTAAVRRDGTLIHLPIVLTEAEVEVPSRWILGIYVDEISELAKAQLSLKGGIAITSFTEDGPAAQAGLLEHDIISQVNGTAISSLEDLRAVLKESNGEAVEVEFVRLGKRLKVDVTPQKLQENVATVDAWTDFSFEEGRATYLPLFYNRLQQADLTTMDGAALAQLGDIAAARGTLLLDAATAMEAQTTKDRLAQIEEILAQLQAAIQELKDQDD